MLPDFEPSRRVIKAGGQMHSYGAHGLRCCRSGSGEGKRCGILPWSRRGLCWLQLLLLFLLL